MEQALVTVSALVFQYDGASEQWKEIGSGSGPSTLSILKSPTNEYRYVAQKMSNNEFVLNAYIYPEMKYDESTATFHQWFDKSKNAFGLNFSDLTMAKKYSAAVACALEQLNTPQMPVKSSPPAIDRSTFSTSTVNTPKKTAADNSARSNTKVSPYATSTVGANAPSIPTSAPKATPVKSSAGAPPPPGPPPPGPPPPGPPPPGPSATKAPAAAGNDFASQLQKAAAQHKAVDIDEQLNKPQSSLTEAKPTTTAPAAGGKSFLDEMKERMAKKVTNEGGNVPPQQNNPVKTTPTYQSNNKTTASTTSRPSIVDVTEASSTTYVTAADLEKFRINLMNDIILNMEKMKNEIISSISAKLN